MAAEIKAGEEGRSKSKLVREETKGAADTPPEKTASVVSSKEAQEMPGILRRILSVITSKLRMGEEAAPSSAAVDSEAKPAGPEPAAPLPGAADSETAAAGPEPAARPWHLLEDQLTHIKAKTMFNMVEELTNGRKLLFLTNHQAELIATDNDALQKMLDALEVGKPGLVIDLIKSPGFVEFTTLSDPIGVEFQRLGELAGIVHGYGPFNTSREERDVSRRLDEFMSDILIPLAASNNAVVLCAAVQSDCVLTASFTRMYAVQRSRWGNTLPFTIISLTNATDAFYRNTKTDSQWSSIRSQSPAWQRADKRVRRTYVAGCIMVHPRPLVCICLADRKSRIEIFQRQGTLVP